MFPYQDEAFDVVFATSVFTHIMPPTSDQYVRQIARVLKPTGRALLTFYVINDEFRRQREAGEKIGFPFSYSRGDHALVSDEKPHAVVAFEETKIMGMLADAGLRLDTLSYGLWRKPGGLTYQDALIVSKF